MASAAHFPSLPLSQVTKIPEYPLSIAALDLYWLCFH